MIHDIRDVETPRLCSVGGGCNTHRDTGSISLYICMHICIYIHLSPYLSLTHTHDLTVSVTVHSSHDLLEARDLEQTQESQVKHEYLVQYNTHLYI